ncbi:NADPH-dependent FMN reductase [Streptomyces sp. ME19-01-6]|uniref:NADPH-dependent FMN reductase n=1 Tax=Streptomyces sp. ME19-01-6 TaxID=3028686 RepID=UPI0029B63CE5|nr:NADPH-dependent FMN reductase [Streptomyces sp. ME19-01-6]MDX3228525.1 NAD(P)H-dependent oxidoreductase [Streptomyces sp. ME19-01-6]
MNRTANLVLISGSLREGSTNTAVVRTLPGLLGDRVRPLEYRGMASLPHFNPDDDVEPLPAEVARLRRVVAEADAVLFCTPEYAGDLPGSFKNLLDWTVGGMEIVDKPVGWINASSSPTGAEGAHRALRTVLGYTGAHLVEEACVRVPVSRAAVDAGTGTVTDPGVREAIAEVARALVGHVAAGWGSSAADGAEEEFADRAAGA